MPSIRKAKVSANLSARNFKLKLIYKTLHKNDLNNKIIDILNDVCAIITKINKVLFGAPLNKLLDVF